MESRDGYGITLSDIIVQVYYDATISVHNALLPHNFTSTKYFRFSPPPNKDLKVYSLNLKSVQFVGQRHTGQLTVSNLLFLLHLVCL